MKPEAMLFDLDGTLLQTETLLIPAFERTFEHVKKEGLYQGETPPVERMLESLGMLLDEIWERVVPGADAALKQRLDELLIHYELDELQNGQARLYDGVKETLEALRAQGIRLFVASNGQEDYVRGAAKWMGIAPLFDDLYSAGEYKTLTKVDLVSKLLATHSISRAWMVGDRSSDVEAGLKNGLTVIGCGYAEFGKADELDGSHAIIRRFPELLDVLAKES